MWITVVDGCEEVLVSNSKPNFREFSGTIMMTVSGCRFLRIPHNKRTDMFGGVGEEAYPTVRNAYDFFSVDRTEEINQRMSLPTYRRTLDVNQQWTTFQLPEQVVANDSTPNP